MLIAGYFEIPYRFLIPFVSQVHARSMDEKQDVDETEKVVWVPESIKAR